MSKETFKDKIIKGIGNNAVGLAYMLGGLTLGCLVILHREYEDRHRAHPTLKDVAIVPDCAIHR